MIYEPHERLLVLRIKQFFNQTNVSSTSTSPGTFGVVRGLFVISVANFFHCLRRLVTIP